MPQEEKTLRPVQEVIEESGIKKKLLPLYDSDLLVDGGNWKEYLEGFHDVQSTQPDPGFWKGKTVLVTGIGGFVGSNTAAELIKYDCHVIGIVSHHDIEKYPNISTLDDVEIDICDLTSSGRVFEIIRNRKPDVIFHYAAISFVPTSSKEPVRVNHNNVDSTINILQALAQTSNPARVYIALSSEQYGFVRSIEELPVKEMVHFRATSPYSASKIAAEVYGESYFYNHNIPVLRVRTFNQEGVGENGKRPRDNRFFTMVVAKDIAEYQQQKIDKIVIRNPLALRDFTHVLDASRAQILAIEHCEPNEPYNVSSRHGVLTGDFALLAAALYDIPPDKVYCDLSKEKLRSYEMFEDVLVHGFVGDNSKFIERTGWRPTRSLADIIRDSVEYQSTRV